ncbi:hypothetical protein LCGC14_1473350 [marine sediment metagenome]|uniref:Uncharacterized protein n=1 Tax=marine sediment metagenome TaxID=412755 RepID=A0A0F9JBM9_9ZZZZ
MHREVRQLIEELVNSPDAVVCKYYAILKIVKYLVEEPSTELTEALLYNDDKKIIEEIWKPWT